MPKDETPKTEVGKSPGYIPRPPSQADVERVSGQQGLIADEWAPSPAPAPGSGPPPDGGAPDKDVPDRRKP